MIDLDKEFEKLIEDIELPSDAQMRREVGNARKMANPVWRKKLKEGIRNKTKTKEWQDAHKKGIEKSRENGHYERLKETNRKSNEERFKDPEVKKKISDEMKNAWQDEEFRNNKIESLRNGVKSKRIVCPLGTFRSIIDMVEQCPELKFYWLKLKVYPHLYYFEEDGPGEPTYEKVWYSPIMITNNRQNIIKKAKETNYENINDFKDVLSWWRKMCRLYPNDFYMKKEIKREWDLEK